MTQDEERAAEIAARISSFDNPDMQPYDVLTIDEYKWYRDYLLTQWMNEERTLDANKTNEGELRRRTVEFISNPFSTKGTERIDLGNNWVAKVEKKINYTFKKGSDGTINVAAIHQALDQILALSFDKQVPHRLVKWEPKLSVTEYEALPEAERAIIDKVVVTSYAMPVLEIIPPKSKS